MCRNDSSAVAWVERQNRDVTFIGVPNPDDGDDADKAQFIDGMSTQISHVLEDPAEFWQRFEVVSQPAMVFIAADGSAERVVGGTNAQALLQRVDDLINQSAT